MLSSGLVLNSTTLPEVSEMAYEGLDHSNPARPPGVRPWKGRVPGDMTAWAKEVINSSSLYPMHSESVRLSSDGRFAMIRVEWHTWSTKGQHGMGGDPNERIQGTFRGATLYEVVDPEAYGTYQYNQQQSNVVVSGGNMRHYYGAAPTVIRKPAPQTITGHAQGLVNLAVKPIRWTFHTTGSLINWLGNTVQHIGNKL